MQTSYETKRYLKLKRILYGKNTSRRKNGRFLTKDEREQVIARTALLSLKARLIALGGARMLFPSAPKRPKKYFPNKTEVFAIYREYRDLLSIYGDSSKTPNSCNCSPYYLAKVYKTSPAVIWGIIKRYAHTGSVEVNGDVYGGRPEGKTAGKSKLSRYARRQARIREAQIAGAAKASSAKKSQQSAAQAAAVEYTDVQPPRCSQRITSVRRVSPPVLPKQHGTPGELDIPLSNPDQDEHMCAYSWTVSQLAKHRIDDTNHTQQELRTIVRHYRDEVGTDDDAPEIKFGVLASSIAKTAGYIQDMESEMYTLEALLGVCPDHQESATREARAKTLRYAVRSHRRTLDTLIRADRPADKPAKRAPRRAQRKTRSGADRPSKKLRQYYLLCRLGLTDTFVFEA